MQTKPPELPGHGADPAMRLMTAIAVISLAATGPIAAQDGHEHQHDMSSAGSAAASELMSSLGRVEVDFELLDRDGNTVEEDDFLGRYVLLGFGFTRCTDVCPLMALNMARVLQAIDEPAAGIFISVDTERDPAAAVDEYGKRFDDRIVGLSGSIEQINQTIKNFNARYVVTKSENGTTVQHTSHLYAIDPQGRLIDVFAFMTSTEEITAAMSQQTHHAH